MLVKAGTVFTTGRAYMHTCRLTMSWLRRDSVNDFNCSKACLDFK